MLGSCKCKSIVNEKFNSTIDSDNVPSLDVEFADVPHSSTDQVSTRRYLITKELIVCSQDKSRVLAARFGRMLAPAVPVPNPESAIIPAPFAMQSTPAQCSSTSSASAKQAAQRQCSKHMRQLKQLMSLESTLRTVFVYLRQISSKPRHSGSCTA